MLSSLSVLSEQLLKRYGDGVRVSLLVRGVNRTVRRPLQQRGNREAANAARGCMVNQEHRFRDNGWPTWPLSGTPLLCCTVLTETLHRSRLPNPKPVYAPGTTSMVDPYAPLSAFPHSLGRTGCPLPSA